MRYSAFNYLIFMILVRLCRLVGVCPNMSEFFSMSVYECLVSPTVVRIRRDKLSVDTRVSEPLAANSTELMSKNRRALA